MKSVKSVIVDINGKPIERSILTEPQSSHVQSLQNIYAEHPSVRLTPRALQAILDEAEQGNLMRQADLFTDMEERDPHLFAEMQKRKRALLTVNSVVVPPPKPTPEERADAAWLGEFITELDEWEDLIIDMMDALGQGFSNSEINWMRYGPEWYPRAFDYRPASWFQLDRNNQNELLLRTDDGQGEKLRPFGWISHRHKSRSGYVARAGLMRTLSWPYIYRNLGAQSLAELLEIYGIPLRIGKYPSGIGKKEKMELMRAVTELGRYAGGIIPTEMEIEIKDAVSGSAAPHLALTEWAEKSMSKAILGGTLTTQADGKTSTNALGVIHEGVRDDLLISDFKQVAATLRRDLFYPMIVLNRRGHADPRRTPRLKSPQLEELIQRKSFAVNPPTPAPAATKSIKPGAVAALVKMLLSRNTTEDPIQRGVDAGVDKVLQSDEPADALIVLLEPALAALSRVDNEAELLAALAEAFPTMDPALLQASLGDTNTIARLIGHAAGQSNE
ncbi:phage portal protein family protein [Leminorella grimontii]|uniref:phage portal protein family protein n=1 Tax=Leminorella grimontii TaxID=82981 RepID=UPI0032208E8E